MVPSRFTKTPKTTKPARDLRRIATDAEKMLWWILRRSCLGISFRRQHPIGSYVADFCIPSIKLVIEVDRGQHGTPHGSTKDYDRKAFLNARGYRVVRFWNNEVLENVEGVLAIILAEIKYLKTTPP